MRGAQIIVESLNSLTCKKEKQQHKNSENCMEEAHIKHI